MQQNYFLPLHFQFHCQIYRTYQGLRLNLSKSSKLNFFCQFWPILNFGVACNWTISDNLTQNKQGQKYRGLTLEKILYTKVSLSVLYRGPKCTCIWGNLIKPIVAYVRQTYRVSYKIGMFPFVVSLISL